MEEFEEFTKTTTSISDLVTLMESRGLFIEDRQRAERYLSNICYYRLSAYMRPFQSNNPNKHDFKHDVKFDTVLDLYIFDRELRLLLFNAIERIEIAFRAQLINCLAMPHGPWWFENSTLFDSKKIIIRGKEIVIFDDNLKTLDKELVRSKELFLEYYDKFKKKPSKRPPCWMTFEVVSFGLLSKIYRNLKMSDEKKAVASHFGLNPYILESWLQSLTYIRNICAHHGRLWNRQLTIQPTMPKHTLNPWLNNINQKDALKLYASLSCILYLLKAVSPTTKLASRIKNLVTEYHHLPLQDIGFTEDWKEDPLWA